MTAVEFLIDKIFGEHTEAWQEEIKQALEMEKQQIIDAATWGGLQETGEQYNTNTMEKLYYLELGELGEIVDRWVEDNPHNNGFAKKWYVLEPEESAYPEIENYLLSLGLKVGDKVILHSVW